MIIIYTISIEPQNNLPNGDMKEVYNCKAI